MSTQTTKKRKADEITTSDGDVVAQSSSAIIKSENPVKNEMDIDVDDEQKDKTTKTSTKVKETDNDKDNNNDNDNQGSSNSQPKHRAPRPKNAYDEMKWILVTNDGTNESMLKLIGLKSLFSKQLPKMPKSYIARLVFDKRHTSLAILNDSNPGLKDSDDEIIGGICYRSFPTMRFAEIAFCAVNANHQVKGYGTKLMNLFKKVAAATGIEYFITYADNYAIGYFKKQGFTKSITMPKGRYTGLIKEYDGGTPMECYIHPSIDFTRIDEMIHAQRNFILQHVKRHTALSHKKVYDPLHKGTFQPSLDGVSRQNQTAARAYAIPGVAEAGWTMGDLIAAAAATSAANAGGGAAGGSGSGIGAAIGSAAGGAGAAGVGGGLVSSRAGDGNALKNELLSIVRKIQEQHFSWPFREPVDTVAVPDYLEVIKEPIDLLTIEKRIKQENHYKSKRMLYADLILMVENCKTYNDEASTYVQCAANVEKYLSTVFDTATTLGGVGGGSGTTGAGGGSSSSVVGGGSN